MSRLLKAKIVLTKEDFVFLVELRPECSLHDAFRAVNDIIV